MISDREHKLAELYGRLERENVPHVVEAVYVPSIRRILLLFSSGLELSLRQDDYSWLREARADQLDTIELNVDGFELYFPKLDEGFWIPDLLEHLLAVRRFLKARVESEKTGLAAA